MIVKNKSLVTSEIVWELVKREIYGYEKIDGILDTFNNCRETGLMFSSFNGTFHIWVFSHRNTDEITVVYGDINNSNNMFNEEEYDNKVRFGYDYEEAAYFVSNLLKKNVEENENA